MKSELKNYLKKIVKASNRAPKQAIDDVERQLNINFPKDYSDIMQVFNGGEGEIGEESWLCLFPIDELAEVNENYRSLLSQKPDFLLFGKDAADMGYAFNRENGTIHAFGLMSNFETDPIKFCGHNFSEFLEYLYNQK